MVGIVSAAVHIPHLRLRRDEIAKTWEAGSSDGEKAVAYYDEDSITMAVSAARHCLRNAAADQIDALFLATTTSPYNEKQGSSVAAAALDLPRHILTADFTSTTRAGTIALQLAMDAVKAGTARTVLVVAADCRMGAPGSDFEQSFGDAAAALLVGKSDFLASIEDSHTHYDEITDIWRTGSDRYLNSWEDRFVVAEGYSRNTIEGAATLMKRSGAAPGDLNHVVLYAPDRRSHAAVARELGFDLRNQVRDPLLDRVGNAGAASVLMQLAAVMEKAKPDERILLCNYGNGADAFLLRVSDRIRTLKDLPGVDEQLQTKKMLPHYGKYLRLREIIGVETARRRPPELSSPTLLWRDRRMVLALIGQQCRRCGKVQYPRQRVCISCLSQDQFDDYKFADRKAALFTFSLDHLSSVIDPPLVKAVVDFEGGGRISCLMTDCDPGEVKIGMPVEMVFRKMHEAMGYPNYWWKCKPVRG